MKKYHDSGLPAHLFLICLVSGLLSSGCFEELDPSPVCYNLNSLSVPDAYRGEISYLLPFWRVENDPHCVTMESKAAIEDQCKDFYKQQLSIDSSELAEAIFPGISFVSAQQVNDTYGYCTLECQSSQSSECECLIDRDCTNARCYNSLIYELDCSDQSSGKCTRCLSDPPTRL